MNTQHACRVLELDSDTWVRLAPAERDAQLTKAWRRIARRYHPDVTTLDPVRASALFAEASTAHGYLRTQRNTRWWQRVRQQWTTLRRDWPRDHEHPMPPPSTLTLAVTLDMVLYGINVVTMPPPPYQHRIALVVAAGFPDNYRTVAVPAHPSLLTLPPAIPVICQVQPHPHYQRHGSDLQLDLCVAPDLLATGGAVLLPPLGQRKITLDIAPQTPTGSTSVLPAFGLPVWNGHGGVGNLTITVHAQTPSSVLDDGVVREAAVC